MARRYEPKGEYIEAEDGSPVDWSRATKRDLLWIEKHELEEEMAQTNPAVAKYRRLNAVDRQLARMATEEKMENEARQNAKEYESSVETKLRTGK